MLSVVDANVFAKTLFDEEHSDLAKALRFSGARLIAPDLIIPECISVAGKKLRHGQITPRKAEAAIVDLRKAASEESLELSPSLPLARRALEMMRTLGEQAVYDSIYLALAEAVGGMMITADAQFCRRVRRSEWREFIRPLVSPLALEK